MPGLLAGASDVKATKHKYDEDMSSSDEEDLAEFTAINEQTPAARRQLRERYFELIKEAREKLESNNSITVDYINNMFKEASRLCVQAVRPREAILDAELFNLLTEMSVKLSEQRANQVGS